jgi:hypothetical protein
LATEDLNEIDAIFDDAELEAPVARLTGVLDIHERLTPR